MNQPHGQAPWEQARPQPGARTGWKLSRRLRWAAGVTAAVLLGAGGAAAGLALTRGGPATANAAQAVALNTALSSSSAAGCATPPGGGAGGGKSARKHCRRIRLRQIKGMYGDVAFHTRSGTQTLAFERGTVVSATGGQLTVRAADGTRWSWDIASNSVVRESGRAVPASTLADGARVFVGGQVVGSSRDARLIVVRTGKKSPARDSSSPGTSASSTSGSAA